MSKTIETEWDQIQRRIGNLPPLEDTDDGKERPFDVDNDGPSNDERLGHKTVEELDALEDDEDEDVLAAYRAKRIEEMKRMQQKNRFGTSPGATDTRRVRSRKRTAVAGRAPERLVPRRSSCHFARTCIATCASVRPLAR